MRNWSGVLLVGAAALVISVGCNTGGSDVAMATDGPNQVVLKVPSMT